MWLPVANLSRPGVREVKPPQWIFAYRGALSNVPVIFALLWTGGESSAQTLLWTLGAALVLAGLWVRVWAQQHLRHRLKTPMELTSTGPYALMRNPLYVGNTLVHVGVTALSLLVWMLPVTLVWSAVVYSLVVRCEEDLLAKHYGEPYRYYCAQTSRWLPRRFPGSGLGLATRYLGAAIVAELHILLIPLPFLLKPWVIERWF